MLEDTSSVLETIHAKRDLKVCLDFKGLGII